MLESVRYTVVSTDLEQKEAMMPLCVAGAVFSFLV